MKTLARLLIALLFLAGDSAWAQGGAGRTRPSGAPSGGAPSHGHGSSSGSHPPSSGGAPAHASGHATYGYGYGYGSSGYPYYGYPYYPYWWWGAPWGPWGFWGSWGPWDGYGAWGWPSPVYTVSAPPPGWSGEGSDWPAVIVTDVQPGKAALRLDGEFVGKAKEYRGTWNKLTVTPGTHVLELESEGYMTLRIALDAKPGASYRIAQTLQKGSGLDPRSTEPKPAAATAAPAGETHAGFLRAGRLRLEVVSPDAAVYLDGEFLGSGRELAALHGALPVPVGAHVIDLVQPGFRRKTMQIDVPDGDPLVLRLELGGEDRE